MFLKCANPLYQLFLQFPGHIQLLIQVFCFNQKEQYKFATEKYYEGSTFTTVPSDATCNCPFYLKYFLPCKHILFQDIFFADCIEEDSVDFLTQDD